MKGRYFQNILSLFCLLTTVLFPSSSEAADCTIKTDYQAGVSCSGSTVTVTNQAGLDAYLLDFGLENGKFKNLKIGFNLTGDDLQIHSPCSITYKKNVVISANNVCLDGREGVGRTVSANIQATTVGILSEQGEAKLATGSSVQADALTMQSLSDTVMIDPTSVITVSGLLSMISTGSSVSSDVMIRQSTQISAGSLLMQSQNQVFIGNASTITVTGPMNLISTGTGEADVEVGSNVQITAALLEMESQKGALINANSVIQVSGPVTLRSLGSFPGSITQIKSSTQLTANALNMTSGKKATLSPQSVVTVTTNFNMEAVNCKIFPTSSVTAGSTSGSCFGQPPPVNLLPIASFTAAPNPVQFGDTVTFTSTSTDSDGTIVLFEWDFGDGETDNLTGSVVTHLYATLGTKIVKLTVTDDQGEKDSVLLPVDVVSESAPFAENITPPSFNEDTESFITLSYTDAQGDLATTCSVSNLVNVTATTVCGCTAGVCTVGVTGTQNFNGSASFDYTVTANGLISNLANAALTITAVDDAPIANNITPPSFAEESESIITLSYTDVDGDLGTACQLSNQTNVIETTVCGCTAGVCTVGVTGAQNFNGSASFDYTVTANGQTSNLANASLTITAVDDAPVANNITPPSFAEDTESIITLNYTDVEGDLGTACQLSNPTNVTETTVCGCTAGVCTVGVTGTPNFNGSASFDYTVTANGQTSNLANAALTITAVDDAPIANNITPPSFAEDTESIITLSYTDTEGDLGTACQLSNQTNVTETTVCGCIAGVCTVGVKGTPNFNGSTNFDYTVTANGQTSNLATAALSITAIDDAPVASDIIPPSFAEDTESIITLNYTDVDGDLANACQLSSQINVTETTVCGCTAGVCTVGVKGPLNFNGLASFNYTVTANGQTSNLANAALVIAAVDDAPIANNITPPSFAEDTESIITLSYSDLDGDLATSCQLTERNQVTESTSCFCQAGICTVGVTGVPNFNGPASFNYTVTTNALASNIAVAFLTINPVLDLPVASFTVGADPVKVGERVTFSSTSTDSDGTIVQYAWDFGDGTLISSAQGTVTHEYSSIGQKTVTLTVTDNDGATAFTSIAIDVIEENIPPFARFSVFPNPIVVGAQAKFTSVSADQDGQIVSYFWEFGDGATDNVSGAIAFHTYTAPGTKIAKLTVTDDKGATGSFEIQVDVSATNSSPLASFTAGPNPGIPNEPVFFTSTSTDTDGIITSFFWDFGDGNTDSTSGVFVPHPYANPGTFIASLTVTDNVGAQSTSQVTVEVLFPNVLPVVTFTATPQPAIIDQEITFTSTATDADGTLTKFEWDFGDGITDDETGAVVTHSFVEPGVFTVSLKVTDDREGTALGELSVEVTLENLEPIADFTLDRDVVNLNNPVNFTSTSTDPDGTLSQFEWDFGDGIIDNTSGAQASHSYTTSGVKTVKLTVTDDNGALASKEQTLVVLEAQTKKDKSEPGTDLVVVTQYPEIELLVGQTYFVSTNAYDQFGVNITPSLSGTWNLDNAFVADFELVHGNTGIIRANNPGIANFRATLGSSISEPLQVRVLQETGGLVVTNPVNGFIRKNVESFISRVSGVVGSRLFSSFFQDENRFIFDGNLFVAFPTIMPGEHDITFTVGQGFGSFSLTKSYQFFDGRGQSLLFDGVDDLAKVDMTDVCSAAANSFSMTLWVRFVDFPSGSRAANLLDLRSQTSGLGWNLETDLSGTPIFSLNTNEAGKQVVVGGLNPLSGKGWVHLGLVYDETSGLLKLYQDGFLKTTQDVGIGQKLCLNAPSDTTFTIGGNNFAGLIDELRFWNQPLSQIDISNELFNPVLTSDSRLISSFSFDSTSSQIILDESGHGTKVILGATQAYNSDDPSFRQASEIVAEGEVGRIGGVVSSPDSKVKLEIPFNAFPFDKKVFIELADPQVSVDSNEERTLFNFLPAGPIVRVHPIKTQFATAATLTLPFDTKQVRENGIENLVAFNRIPRTGITRVLKPISIDMDKGLAQFPIFKAGTFWTNVEKGIRPEIEYSTPLFSEFPLSNKFDRILQTTVIRSGTGPFNVSIDGQLDGASIAYIFCNGSYRPTPSTFPITFQAMVVGNNSCVVKFQKFFGAGILEIFHQFFIRINTE